MAVAYLDPGSGSLIASALVGGAAAAGVAVKQARVRFTGVFSRKRKSDADGEQPEAPEATDAEGDQTEGDKADTKASGESAEAPVAADAGRSDA